MSNNDRKEAALIGTLRFVFVTGIVFAILWFGMFVLLKDRW
jgi:hypothetical protein